ncbi:MAG: hypothetical protein ACOYEV_14695 [Candidatus Nanopelagicales bacterium]
MKRNRMSVAIGTLAALAVPIVAAVAFSPIGVADGGEDKFTEDIAHWNSLGGQIPGRPSNWLSAAQTVCDGISELHAGGVPTQRAVDAQINSAVAGGWIQRDGFYFVIHAVNSFCPEFRPHG